MKTIILFFAIMTATAVLVLGCPGGDDDNNNDNDNTGIIEELTVPSDGTVVSTTNTFASGKYYKIIVSGTYQWGLCQVIHCPDSEEACIENDMVKRMGDAQYRTDDCWKTASYDGSTVMMYCDNEPAEWGYYDENNHEYHLIRKGKDAVFSFNIYDSPGCYGDNAGELQVKIMESDAMLVRGINYFPGEHTFGRMWRNWDPDVIRADLDVMHDMNINAIRIFLYMDDIESYTDIKQKIDQIISECNSRGIQIIFDLFPFSSGDQAQYPAGDLTVNGETFLNEIVGEYKDNNTILMWELINEPAAGWKDLPNDWQNRLIDGINLVKQLDGGNHRVSVPFRGDTVGQLTGTLLAANDVLNVHLYNMYGDPMETKNANDLHNPAPFMDFVKNTANNKPVFLGEFGCFACECAGCDVNTHDPNNPSDFHWCSPYDKGQNEDFYRLKQKELYMRVYTEALKRDFWGMAAWIFSEDEWWDPQDCGDTALPGCEQNRISDEDQYYGIVKLDQSLTCAADILKKLYKR